MPAQQRHAFNQSECTQNQAPPVDDCPWQMMQQKSAHAQSQPIGNQPSSQPSPASQNIQPPNQTPNGHNPTPEQRMQIPQVKLIYKT